MTPQTAFSRRIKFLASMLALAAVVHLFAGGCGDDATTPDLTPTGSTPTPPTTTTPTTTTPPTTTPPTTPDLLSGNCSGDQNSLTNTDMANLDCLITSNSQDMTLSGGCEMTEYFCAGSGTIENGTFDEDGNCSFDVVYDSSTVMNYSCDVSTLDLDAQRVDLNYFVINQDSRCSEDQGIVEDFTCTQSP